jgi:hypothetical protein
MSDTSQATPAAKAKRAPVAIREWIDNKGNPVETGKEAEAVGFRYISLTAAKAINPAYNPESDSPPAGAYFDYVCGEAGQPATMLACFGGLTLAGNVANSINNGDKGDPTANPIPDITARFQEIDKGVWTDRKGGGGIRYDREKLAAAIASAKGEADPAPYLAKLDIKVDANIGTPVPADTKGAISYGAFALRVPQVKEAYDKLTGGGVRISML